MIRAFLARLFRRPRPVEVPRPRFEIQESPAGVVWLLDFERRRKYPFAARHNAELALAMLQRESPSAAPLLLSIPFSNVDNRKAL